MVHYCRLNARQVHSSSEEARYSLYIWLFPYTSFIVLPLCARLYYRFAKLTFLWWNNGVARRDGSDGGESRRCAGEGQKGPIRREPESIVIRINRLRRTILFVDGPPSSRTQSMIFVLLYFIPRVVERSAAACDELRVSRSDLRITDDGRRKSGSFEGRTRLIYLEL